MTIEFTISTFIPASPQEIYRTWLSSEGHAAMTGSPATVSAEVGGEFEAWDGYISGRNIELEPGSRILQYWRTVEFGEDDPDSLLEITLEPIENQTKLTLRHTGLSKGGEQYEQGWIDSYFEPMKEYFTLRSERHSAS